MKFQLPAPLLVVLGLLGGVLEYLNQATFGFPHPWDQLITFGLFIIPLLGATVLVGPQFQAALHLPASVVTAIGVVMAALAAAVTTFSLSGGVKGLIEGLIAFLLFAGFNPVPVIPVPPAPVAQAHRTRSPHTPR